MGQSFSALGGHGARMTSAPKLAAHQLTKAVLQVERELVVGPQLHHELAEGLVEVLPRPAGKARRTAQRGRMRARAFQPLASPSSSVGALLTCQTRAWRRTRRR